MKLVSTIVVVSLLLYASWQLAAAMSQEATMLALGVVFGAALVGGISIFFIASASENGRKSYHIHYHNNRRDTNVKLID